jgi:hypothetical protein
VLVVELLFIVGFSRGRRSKFAAVEDIILRGCSTYWNQADLPRGTPSATSGKMCACRCNLISAVNHDASSYPTWGVASSSFALVHALALVHLGLLGLGVTNGYPVSSLVS